MQLIKRLPTPDDARAARERIAPYVRRTPNVAYDGIVFKLEFLQVSGSFKPRGAFNALLQLDEQARSRGVVAFSGGNHGLAVARVASRLNVPATIFMPRTTPGSVVERARADRAEVVLTETIAQALEQVEVRAASGQALIHPYDDERVIEGQGTIGLELLEDIPGLSTLVVSIGGGGLIAGIASVVKASKPQVRVYGVETRGADAMRRALDAGRPVTMPAITSIARTLGAPVVSDTTLRAVQTLVEDVVTVDDADAVAAIVELADELHVTVEPAAACCLAALRLGLVPRAHQGTTATLLCGANVAPDELAAWRSSFAR